MARDYFDESKDKKKKKEKAATTTKSQSSSVTKSNPTVNRVNERAQGSTFLSGGGSTSSYQNQNQKPKTVKKPAAQKQTSTAPTTSRQTTPQRTTDTGTGRRRYSRTEATDYNNNLKQTAARDSRTRARRTLNEVDDFARRTANRAATWEKENLSARNQMLETQRAARNQKVAERASERMQNKYGKQELSEKQKAFSDYTSGVIQRKALGYAKTASDLLKTNEGYKAQGRWAQEDPEFARRISSHEFAKRADKAFNDYSVKQEEVQKRLSKIENNTSGAGKVALQAYGSGLEMGMDRLAGPLWAASMFASAYGNQRGQALKEGASDEQDSRAAFLGAGVEVATEYMFKPVAGIASKFGGKHSMDFAGKLAAKVTSKLTGNKARIADIAVRTLGSQVEEGLEEVAGWAVNPYAQNLAYKNDLQKKREADAHADYNDMQQSFWNQFDTEEEAQQAALYVNSSEFINDQVKTYKESGATDEEARSMARILQKYFLAHFDNDEEAAEAAEAEMDKFVVGDIREKHDWKELGQTLASTFLLTGVTGGASTYYTNQIGNQMLQGEVGKDRVKQYTDIVIKYDPDNAKDAKYVKDTIDNGGTPTGTQVYQVASQATEVLQEMGKRETASDQVKQRRMRDEDLQVAPVVMTARGPQFNEMTGKAYQASYDKALGVVRGVRKHGTDVGLSEDTLTSPETMRTAANAVAAYETGTITAEQINDLTIDNPETRTIFELATGVDLAQYNVMKRGKIDEVASNNAMMNGLLANAADNYVQMARAEQKQWSNRTRGRVLNAMSTSFGEKGNLAMHDVLKAADPRNQQKYMLTARIAQNVYDYARRTDISWEKMKNAYKGSFKEINIDAMKDVYDAAKMDKDQAETAYLGREVIAGEAMRFEKSDNGVARVVGQFTNDSARELTGEEDEAMRAVADRLGVNIRIVPDSEMTIDGRMSAGENAENVPHFNGSYDSGTNTILLAETNGLNDNILYAMSHETTHLLKQYAPDAYMNLSNYVMDKFYKSAPGKYESAIKAKQGLYKRAVNQDLSEEAALEEIIADATRDFWSDPEFVNQISNDIEEPGFFKSIVNAIRDMLRHIRNLLSSGHFDGTEHEDVLWNLLGTYSKAEKLWLDAYRQAARNRAQMAIDELHDNIIEESRTTGTVQFDVADIDNLDMTNKTVEDNDGNSVAKFQDNGSVSFSISSYENEGRKIYKDYLDKLVNDKELSQEEADQMLNELETIYNISKRFADSGRFEPYTAWSYADVVTDAKGRPVFSSIRKNSEYKMNIDFSTICKKRRTLDAVFREMIRRGMFEKLDLNKDESAAMVVNINNLIRKNQFEAACALCFVEARRYRQQQTAKTFTNMWNELVESMYSDKDKIAYFNFGRDEQVQDVSDGIHTMDDSQLDLSHVRAVAEELNDKGKPKQTAEAKAARLILNNPEQRKLMRVGDMMASTGFENMQVENPELMKVYNSKKGTGGAKSSFGDVQYLNEIINSKTFDRQKAYDVSGVRIQSFSDYVPRMVFDYVQVIADLAAKKLPAHAYTKEPLFVKQFGLSGVKINLSLVPDVVPDGIAPGLDANGDYIWNVEGTFPYDEAMKIQEAEGYKENCGTIAVGISNEQIMKMLADPTIQMVIPYHKSSLNPIVAAMTNVDRFTNYEDFQNTKNEEGKAVKTDFAWDKKLFGLTHYTRGEKKGELKPREQWGNVQDLVKEYVEWCEKKNYTPKFSQFLYQRVDNKFDGDFVLDENGNKVINPGYYKLLEDFALLDNEGNFKPQGDVQMRFPTAESAFDSMEELIKQGLSEDTQLEADRSAKIGGIVDEIENMMAEGTLTEQSVTSQKLAQKFSISPEMDDAYMDAVNSGNMDEAQRLVDEAAKAAGYTERVYHGTGANFTAFDINRAGNNHGGYSMFGKGFYFSDSEAVANAWGKDRKLMHTFIRLENPYIASDDITEGPLFDAFTELRNKWGFPKKDTLDGILAFETLNEQYGYDYTTELLKENGYDGVVYTHPKTSGRKAGTKEYIVFDAENIKSADPVTYDIGYKENGNRTKSVIPLSERFDPTNNDIRYSLPTQDSDGNILTDGQMEYFRNSQARNSEGKMQVVYHTTNYGGFTIFDPSYSEDGRSIFFTDSEAVSKTYGTKDSRTTYECYLNFENPMIVDADYNAWDRIPITRQVGNISLTEDYDTNEVSRIAFEAGYDGVIIRNCRDWAVDDSSEFDTYSIPDENEVKEYVAQTADNIDDIPLSDAVLEQNRQNHIASAAIFQNSIVSSWEKRTLNLEQRKTPLKNQLISLMKTVRKDSGTERQYKAETLDETIKAVKSMYEYAKKDNAQEFAKEAWDAAERIVDDIDYNDDLYEKYKEMQTFFERNKIAPPSELYADEVYGEFETFKRENDGKIRWATHALQDLQGDEEELDLAYRILHREYPMFFTEAYSDNPIDQLMQMAAALNNTDAYRDAYTSEEHAKLVENIANNLCDIVSEGNEYRATIDELKVKAMKQRHEEALRKVREERNAIADYERNRANRWKQKYNDRIQKEKAERNEKADKREHLKSFGHIEKNYNKLCSWVLNPTKEKNVPEEFRKSLADFLQALDLQTENSKKLEAKTGRVAQKTLKMRELKDRLNDLSARKGDDGTSIWEVDESIAFLLGKLADKLDENGNTIDALDNDDIATIDVFMQLLIRNIERYKQVKTETKMAELSDIGGRAVTFLRDKIERDGMFKKKGAIQTINATALTPAYLFDRLGALKEMYDVLRYNGFDTYIRNEKMIMDRIGEILSGYYKTNKKGELLPGSEAEKWRDDRSAQTIELENGKSITMTAAQMMSLYCLTKRGMQAIGHMCVGGVVVTPIQTGSKIQAAKDRIKNRGTEESTEKRVLTINDIRNIISKLTEDQIKVADQLQSLMSNEMAQLGNEAHRELYGYEMFNEDNYFPIKVYGNERSTDINTIGDVIEKIKSFGFTKPLTPNANKALEIDDIFSVVADHCNGMNLYNAYLVPITDFMKVLNYTHTFEDGTVLTMKEAIEQAYGKDMLKYILNLMKDINGIKGENRGGLEGIMNKALGTAKRTAVFGNVRVALQQPTAIVRAAAEINPKYIKGAMHLDSAKGFIPTVETKTMQEMWKYCPIAQWKAWGYYDTYMGRDIEDVMMNKWSIGDKLLSGYYGQLDNATWSMIWQAVKAEQRDAHPDMDHNSEEFLQICGRRASEVFDKTQVVDSTFHRSDAMRNKQIAVKLFTAFMAEPTLTMNVFRAGLFNANEASKAGNKGEAAKIRARAISVIVVQAVVVSAAQAFADAWRGKDPGLPWDDDDDEEKIGYWWRWIHNFVYNCFDQAHLENNMYLVKDVTPYINYMISQAADYGNWNPTLRAVMGWDQDYLYSQNNLVFAGLENTANGVAQLFKKLEKGDEYVDYKTKEPKKWYDIIQKIASGIGTFTGLPVGTLMRDFKPFIEKFLPAVYAADTGLMDSIANKMGYQKSDNSSASTTENEEAGKSDNVPTRESLPDNLSDEQKDEIIKSATKRAEKAKPAEEQQQLDYDTMLYNALKAASGLEGEEYNKKVYSSVANGLKGYIADGDYTSIGMMRTVIEQAGGDVDYFDKRVLEETKTAYKKTLSYDQTLEERNNMKAMYRYMMKHGMTQEQLSADILCKSDLAKDMKVAYRLGDDNLIYEAMLPLVDAGITRTDLERLYENRNKMSLESYKKTGRYKDKLKSMGTFIWPATGPITSHFGYRTDVASVGGSTDHPAIDIGIPVGTPVVAADGGVVILAGSNYGYGYSVGIKHDNGMVTYYNHLDSWNVKVGDTVAQGQQIACSGNTGRSTGPHLDFKILDKNGKPVDPEKLLSGSI